MKLAPAWQHHNVLRWSLLAVNVHRLACACKGFSGWRGVLRCPSRPSGSKRSGSSSPAAPQGALISHRVLQDMRHGIMTAEAQPMRSRRGFDFSLFYSPTGPAESLSEGARAAPRRARPGRRARDTPSPMRRPTRDRKATRDPDGDCVASVRRGLPWGRKLYLLTYDGDTRRDPAGRVRAAPPARAPSLGARTAAPRSPVRRD